MKAIVLQLMALVSLTAMASTAFAVSDLTITKSHTGDFAAGQQGVYNVVVSNGGADPTSGTVTMNDPLPTGLTLQSVVSGNEWNCTSSTVTLAVCSTATALPAGGSFSTIALHVAVASKAPASVTNTATVSGGGETNTSNDSSSDQTTIVGSTPVRLQSFEVD